MSTVVKDSCEYGWLIISRAEYEGLCAHGYAGTDEQGVVWALAMDGQGATCLWRGLEIVDA